MSRVPPPKVYLAVAKGFKAELAKAWKDANQFAKDNPIATAIASLAASGIVGSKHTTKPSSDTHDHIEIDG